MLRIEMSGPDQQSLLFERTRKIFLRQRRALIGQMGLRPDECQRTLESLPPQGIDGLRGRLTSADDEDAVAHGPESIAQGSRPRSHHLRATPRVRRAGMVQQPPPAAYDRAKLRD